jgi:hypothetical protein
VITTVCLYLTKVPKGASGSNSSTNGIPAEILLISSLVTNISKLGILATASASSLIVSNFSGASPIKSANF